MQAKAFYHYLDQKWGYAKKRPNNSWPILFWPSVSFLSVSHNGRVAWTQLSSPTERSSVDDVRARAATSRDGAPPVTVETLVVAGTSWARGGGAGLLVRKRCCVEWTVECGPAGGNARLPGPASSPAAHAAPFISAGLRTRGGHRGRYSAWASGVRCLGRRMGSRGEGSHGCGPRVSLSFSNGVVEGVMTHKFITWSKDGFDPGASQELQRAGSGPATDSASLPFQAPARFSCRNGAHVGPG